MKHSPARARPWFANLWIWVPGALATLWFLIRVIPKPSRATYPCMKAAAPLVSTFVVYLLGISASVFSFRRFRRALQQSRYLSGSLFLLLTLSAYGMIFLHGQKETLAGIFNPVDDTFPLPSNDPIGEAKGLFPGRVVWVHDTAATNEAYRPVKGGSDYWYSDENADETVIHGMLEAAIRQYAGKEDLAAAWDAIFTWFNQNHGRGDAGYTPGEKIAFKINLTNQSAKDEERPLRMDATPQLLNAILDQLINVVGVSPYDITLGDPYREWRREYRERVTARFPDVQYVDGTGYADGVEMTVPTLQMVLEFSDKDMKSSLPEYYLEADYLINIPCLKTHDEGGITLIAKNHQGSYLEEQMSPANQSAYYMHYSLPRNLRGTGKYRHTVDYMGHEQTGGKALIYIIDGIWAGTSWQGWISKFRSDPFGFDYPSSLLVGMDPVALESVCWDILFEEYRVDVGKPNYPIDLKLEIADYLKQCASSDYWPEGITYDPEGDGTPIGSLGVLEHWNNAADRQYSRNLSETGTGIELVYVNPHQAPVGMEEVQRSGASLAYPNPFTSHTRFRLPDGFSPGSLLEIYDMKGSCIRSFRFHGKEITWDGTGERTGKLPGGIYPYRVTDPGTREALSGKVVLR